jgi:hypothetical protein
VLQSGQQTFSRANTFHFVLDTQNPGASPNATSFYPTKADGDVVVPDQVKANVTVSLGALTATTQAIAIGNQAWYLNPLTNKWVAASGFSSFSNLFNPQTGLASLLTQIQNPSTPTDRSLGGSTHCWSIQGTLSSATVANMVGSGISSPAPINVSVCIGKDDHQLDLVTLTGVLIPGDKAQTEHDFTLSKYGESVTISPPVSQ